MVPKENVADVLYNICNNMKKLINFTERHLQKSPTWNITKT